MKAKPRSRRRRPIARVTQQTANVCCFAARRSQCARAVMCGAGARHAKATQRLLQRRNGTGQPAEGLPRASRPGTQRGTRRVLGLHTSESFARSRSASGRSRSPISSRLSVNTPSGRVGPHADRGRGRLCPAGALSAGGSSVGPQWPVWRREALPCERPSRMRSPQANGPVCVCSLKSPVHMPERPGRGGRSMGVGASGGCDGGRRSARVAAPVRRAAPRPSRGDSPGLLSPVLSPRACAAASPAATAWLARAPTRHGAGEHPADRGAAAAAGPPRVASAEPTNPPG